MLVLTINGDQCKDIKSIKNYVILETSVQ